MSSSETAPSSAGEDVQRHWQGVVRRGSFLKGSVGPEQHSSPVHYSRPMAGLKSKLSDGKLSAGDVALLPFALWAEIVGTDLWTQYAKLGGVGPSGGGAAQASEEFRGFIGGNPAYTLALQNLDGDMPRYITDNTDDEVSHATFLKAFLMSRAEVPVDLKPFRVLLTAELEAACQSPGNHEHSPFLARENGTGPDHSSSLGATAR